jgi:hypothetical protein
MTASDKARALGWDVDPGPCNPKGAKIKELIDHWNRQAQDAVPEWLTRLEQAIDESS